MSRVIAIIQARLGSSRLPLKSLICLHDLPIIDWVTSRVAKSRNIAGFIVATTDTSLDKALLQHFKKTATPAMAGPENDVLRRFALAAEMTGADAVVRICADNPCVWWEAIDELVDFFHQSRCDYCWNHIPRGCLWPDGLGAEIVSAETLRRIDRDATLPAQREHCFNYIWDNAANFSMATFDPAESWLRRPEVKLDIDNRADYERLALLPITAATGAREILAAWDAGAPELREI